MPRPVFTLLPCLLVLGCSKPSGGALPSAATAIRMASAQHPEASAASGPSLTIHFYDVGQGLAALVDLPHGRHVLVDTGDRPGRAGCGDPCGVASRHLTASLREDLAGAPIDLVWITHRHSDHIGGVEEVLDAFRCARTWTTGVTGATQRCAARADRLEPTARRSRSSIPPTSNSPWPSLPT